MIWVRLRDHPNKQVFISETDYDPKKHIKPSKEEEEDIKESHSFNIKMICKTKSAPGMHLKSKANGVTYNGKLDSGAADVLLEKGLDSAKVRANERQKKTGHAFRKVKSGKLVPRKSKRRK